MLFVQNNFMNRRSITTSSNLREEFYETYFEMYNKIGRLNPLMSLSTDSSEAILPVLPEIELAARWKERLE